MASDTIDPSVHRLELLAHFGACRGCASLFAHARRCGDLHALEEAQLEGVLTTRADALAWVARTHPPNASAAERTPAPPRERRRE